MAWGGEYDPDYAAPLASACSPFLRSICLSDSHREIPARGGVCLSACTYLHLLLLFTSLLDYHLTSVPTQLCLWRVVSRDLVVPMDAALGEPYQRLAARQDRVGKAVKAAANFVDRTASSAAYVLRQFPLGEWRRVAVQAGGNLACRQSCASLFADNMRNGNRSWACGVPCQQLLFWQPTVLRECCPIVSRCPHCSPRTDCVRVCCWLAPMPMQRASLCWPTCCSSMATCTL